MKKTMNAKMKRHPLRWATFGVFAALVFVVGVTAARTATMKPAGIVAPASPVDTRANAAIQTPTEWPGWVHGKDENDLDFDLSEGRGDHKEQLILPRAQPVDVLLENADGPYLGKKTIDELKPGDRVRMVHGQIGLVLTNTRVADRGVPPRGQSDVIGKSERLTDTLLFINATGDEIHTTPEHPFMVKGKGWIEAGKLQPGDLLDAGKAHVEVVSSEVRKVSPPERIYNLETWPDHVFRIGRNHVLVHNGGCVTPPAGGFEVAEGAGQGASFNSYEAYKNVMGSASPNSQWHHIVEQNPTNIARFGSEPIQNTGNILRLDTGIHRQISAYYSSIDPAVSSTMRVRDWVSAQPFGVQRQFGQDALRMFGVTP